MPDNTAVDREPERYASSLTCFLKPTSERACAHSCLRIIEDGSCRATVNCLLQSCAYWTVHWDQTVARTFALRVHQKKPIRSHFYISPVSRSKPRDAAKVDVLDLQSQQLRMLSNSGSERYFDRSTQVCQVI